MAHSSPREVDDVMSSSEYRRITGKTETVEDNFLFGRVKRFDALDKKEKAFLFIASISMLATAAVAIYRLATIHRLSENSGQKREDITFAILLLISCGFLLYFAIHGVLREREFELWAFIAALVIVGMYIVWNFFTTPHSVNRDSGFYRAKLARMIIFFVAAIPNGVLAFLVAREFRWLEFRIVGADPLLQSMFRAYSRFSTLLVFDLQILIYVLVMVYNPGSKSQTAEKVLVPILAAITIIVSIAAIQGVIKEKKSLVLLWGALLPLELAYFAWKCFSIWKYWKSSDFDKELAEIFYVGAAIAIIVRGAAAYCASVCYDNFGYGLKQRAFGRN